MTDDAFTATLRRHFGPGSFIEGAPPDPVAVFPAKHPDVGEVKIWQPTWTASTIGLMGLVRVAIGSQFLQQFENLDTHLEGEERSRRLTADIIRFLEKLFADQLLLWRGVQDRHISKWRECSSPASFEPIALDNEEYALYLWSGPRGTWKLVPAILTRGAVRNDVEWELLRQQVADGALVGADRALAVRLLKGYAPEQEP
jgi:hypothetical protein